MGAHQRKRQLSRQELVVGQPRPSQSFRQQIGGFRRSVHDTQRVGEGRKAFARNPTRLLPFGQGPYAGKSCVNGFVYLIETEPLRQGIHGLDQRQLRQIDLGDDAVGVHHLPCMVIEGDRARYVSPLSHGQQLLQVILARIEISQSEIAGLVAGIDLIGRTRPVRRWRPVSIEGDRDGDDGVGHHVAQFRPRAAVDRAGGQMKQEVDDTRLVLAAEQPTVELLEPRADAGERRNQGKKRIEQARPHGPSRTFVANARAAAPDRQCGLARRCYRPG